MCGRYTLRSSGAEVARRFGLAEVPQLEARYNVAPSQLVPTVRQPEAGAPRVLELRRWGLVPSWAKDPRIGNRMINARAETVADKPAFRVAFRQRRCLVPMDGFYEWRREGKRNVPHHVRLASQEPFGVAGLWERWRGEDGEALETCTLLTTAASARLRALHDRMPVVLDPSDHALWLDPDARDTGRLQELLRPQEEWPFEIVAVGPRVSDPRRDDPECLLPAPAL